MHSRKNFITTRNKLYTYSSCHFPLFQALKSLLKCIAKDWVTVETKTGRERMVNIATISRKITITSTILCHFVFVAYMLLRLFSLKHSDNKLFFRGYFPYDVNISPNYELTMIGQAIAMTCSTIFYSTVDTFIAMLILHACGQLSNLKEDLVKIHSYDKSNLHMKLKKVVQKHDYVNRFVLNGNIMILLIVDY